MNGKIVYYEQCKKKERLLYAALNLFAEKGYDGVGVDLIAENAMGRIQFTMHDDIIRKTIRILAMEQFCSKWMAELTTRYHLENLLWYGR